MPKAPIPLTAQLTFVNRPTDTFEAAIAIPSYNESSTLPEVLKSLEKNPLDYISKTLVVVNVNNRLSADNKDNLKTLEYLKSYKGTIPLAYLDSTNPPFSYPEKFGVGLARHQAVSASLELISERSPVISLDGDSPVNPQYLQSIFGYIQENPEFKAGHVNFQHRQDGSDKENHAIKLYDAHLHRHREGLLKAGSPHAWYAIGSTIVCTKKAYLKSGGYNPRRMAGEDFYLLQQLSKCGYNINMIEDAFVYPSCRGSDRVPFGTGKAVNDIISDGDWYTYHPGCYEQLKSLLDAVYSNLSSDSETIVCSVPEAVKSWLESRNFTTVWQRLQQNSKNSEKLKQSFDEWLDAFQTLKLIHHLTENGFPKVKIQL